MNRTRFRITHNISHSMATTSLALILFCSSFFYEHTELKAEETSVCVICNDPGKVYQCHYKSPLNSISEGQSETKSINVKGLQFACIQEIAQYGGHGLCAARKNNANCNGEPYILKNKASLEQKQTLSNEESPEGQMTQTPKPPTIVKPTLVDETKKSYNKTTSSVKKTYNKTTEKVKNSVKSVGKKIGNAASSTYDCLTSFFQECGN